MNVKLDTKEKFTVITPLEQELSANMTDELKNLLLPYIQKDIPHIVLNMHAVQNIDDQTAVALAAVQEQFYAQHCSFVICCLHERVIKILEEKEMLEFMNVTPTESEAWDMLQMEEVERELLGD